MTNKNFVAVAGLVFGVVAIAHAWRFLSGSQLVIGSFTVPGWFSAVAALFAGYLAYQGFRLKK